MYLSTKTYGHELGLSCAFRQWRATHSHCSTLHGYSLAFKFVFSCETLDDKNWCVDFGNLKELKAELVELFDHRTAIAKDDPELPYFKKGDELGVLSLIVFDNVGCESFAQYAYNLADHIIYMKYEGRVKVVSCECSEHSGNSAIFSI